MTDSQATMHESFPDHHHDLYSKTVFGFWIYLLTDFILFATFFATYAVLHKSTYGGPSSSDLFDFSMALNQTLLLLTASFIVGLGGATAHRKNRPWTIALFGCAALLGIIFFGLQMKELVHLVHQGNGWDRSAFLSAFFSLVGTHAAHMFFAIVWVIVLLIPVVREGITAVSIRRLTCLRMFWQFLNIIWVFIFALVYFMEGRLA